MSNTTPYKINWLDLSYLGYIDSVGIGSLPGSRHRFITRDFGQDKATILENGIHHAILLCESRELDRFGVSNLLNHCQPESYDGLQVHHYPTEIGMYPDIEILLDIIRKVFRILEQGQKCLIISRDGLGRACVIGAVLLLHTNDNLTYADAYDSIKNICGPRAVQTVKQYNFLVDFRSLRDECIAAKNDYSEDRNNCERQLSR